MSVSNYVCSQGGGVPVTYVRCWVPVQYVQAGVQSGIIPMIHRAKHVLTKVVNGGTVEEHRLFAELMALMKAESANMAKEVQQGVVDAHLIHLIEVIKKYEDEYLRAHPEKRATPLPSNQGYPPPPPPAFYPPQQYPPPAPIPSAPPHPGRYSSQG